MANETEKQEINWDAFETGQFIKLVAGRPKTVTCESVKQEMSEFVKKDEHGQPVGEPKQTPALTFLVSKEDGQKVDKKLQVTSKQLVKALRPFVESGFPFAVKITAFGERFDRE